jgi:nucleoside-diphosphate-sugar epimerase
LSQVIAVIGANGFVGKAISFELIKNKNTTLVPIIRGDNIEEKLNKVNIVIHTANPSKRFFAQNNPQKDFMESVEKTYEIKQFCRGKKLILISSISARSQLNTVYGRNRRSCELMMNFEKDLIIRLGPMYGGGKKVGALHDILTNKTVYVSGKTQYAYVDVLYNAKKIVDSINKTSLVEFGAKNGIALSEIKNLVKSSSEFIGEDDTQIPINPQSDAPDSTEVINYIKHVNKNV